MSIRTARDTPRLTRPERRERTRGDLLAAARAVFERHGFHRASLDGIADEAGYTKGAVYSHFPGGKDELFLAVLDRHIDERVPRYAEIVLSQDSFEASLRAIARHLVVLGRGDPAWTPLLVEFWTHASHDPALQAAVRERNDRQARAIAAVIDELAARHGVTLGPAYRRGRARLGGARARHGARAARVPRRAARRDVRGAVRRAR